MKTLELRQMENFRGGDMETCAGLGTGVAIGGAALILIGIGTGGVGFAVAGLLGSWLGAGAYGACLFK